MRQFCKTEKYVEVMQIVFDYEVTPPDEDEGAKSRQEIDDLGMKSPVRAYVTVSQVRPAYLSEIGILLFLMSIAPFDRPPTRSRRR